MQADRVEMRQVTVAANTTQAAAVETDLSFPAGWVQELEIVIPDGHAGLTGIAIAQAHQVTIPAAGLVWIVSNDEVIRWELKDTLGSGQWSAFTYNLDTVNPHSFYIRFLIREAAGSQPATPSTPIAAADIASAGDQLVTADAAS